ncbi:MAG: BrnT family toxin [Rhodocyclaceae bacterium]|nr:BrnT family toxin [Rhodocyclaceae bacterium]
MSRIIEWDDAKDAANYRKHGIRFEAAAWVFEDPFALSVQDRIENGEQRWQTIGVVGGCLLVLVAHTVQLGAVEVIRIISARRADRKERKRYEQG